MLTACADARVAPGARTTTLAEITPAGTATASPVPATIPTRSPTPTSTSTHTGATTLTEADSGSTVVLKVGESVQVSLPSDYHRPEAQGSAIRRTEVSGGYPTGQPATATFTVEEKGNAEISSTTDYACLHATPACALPQQLWSVRITVR